ncbi:MAG: Re/Si-specific NAD(P)(+) transhydrogenase subunit alpha [Chromatiales bacterium]|nr:Re/Si-specific NAD(P)(+) transhydrogenase subunit alpha [Chromatiales bacterium]
MKIGILKETLPGERRVAAVPDTVKRYVARGAAVLLERGAGDAAAYTDAQFEAVGAQCVDRAAALAADLVLKVRRPERDDLAQMRSGAVHVSLLELCEDDGTLAAASAQGVKIFAMERIPRISRAQSMDALSSQANIAGYRAVLEGANRYGRFLPLMMTAAGSAKPAKFYVLGAGVAGLQAIATARRLGAEVWAYDVRPEVREQIESLGAKFLELEVGESGAGQGGYAKELSDEAKARQQAALEQALTRADIVVSTALIPCRPAPVLVTEAAVQGMREGSVVVDLAAATGGNCPLTKADEVITAHGVTIVGFTNYPSMLAADASSFYARNLLNLFELMTADRDGSREFIDFASDEITAAAWANREESH